MTCRSTYSLEPSCFCSASTHRNWDIDSIVCYTNRGHSGRIVVLHKYRTVYSGQIAVIDLYLKRHSRICSHYHSIITIYTRQCLVYYRRWSHGTDIIRLFFSAISDSMYYAFSSGDVIMLADGRPGVFCCPLFSSSWRSVRPIVLII